MKVLMVTTSGNFVNRWEAPPCRNTQARSVRACSSSLSLTKQEPNHQNSCGRQNHLYTRNMVTRVTKNIITTWFTKSKWWRKAPTRWRHNKKSHHKSPKEKYQKYQQKLHQEKSYQKKSTSHPISPTSLCTLLLQHDPQCKKKAQSQIDKKEK